jgi:hypothetical protein
LKENSAAVFGRADDLAACGPPMRLIVTITRADEVRRAKSRFFATADFASLATQSTLIGHPQTEELRDPLGHA